MLPRQTTPYLLLIAAFALVAVPLPTSAQVLPETQVLAGPGAWVSTYTTQVVAVEQGGDLAFTNADLMRHDVISTAKGTDDAAWCDPYPEGACPLFWSRLVGLGEETPVLGLDALEPGQTYEFFCSIHPGMTGTLVALDPIDP